MDGGFTNPVPVNYNGSSRSHRQTAGRRMEAAENRGGELRRGIQEDGLWH